MIAEYDMINLYLELRFRSLTTTTAATATAAAVVGISFYRRHESLNKTFSSFPFLYFSQI